MPRYSDDFGNALTLTLERHGVDGKPMSLRVAARKTGFSYSSIQNWKNGEIPADPNTIRSLADHFNEPRSPLLDLAGYKVENEDWENDREKYGIETKSILPSSVMERFSVKISGGPKIDIPGRSFIDLQREGSPMLGFYSLKVNADFGPEAQAGWTLEVEGTDDVQPGDLVFMVTRGGDGEECYIADTLKTIEGEEVYCFTRGEEARGEVIVFKGIITDQLKSAKNGPTA